MKHLTEILLAMILFVGGSTAIAQNGNGNNNNSGNGGGAQNGQPFLDIQAAIDAAEAALAAAVEANSVAAAANTSAIAAEVAARESADAAQDILIAANAAAIQAEAAALAAEDAALQAQLIAETLARETGDAELWDAIDEEELTRMADLDLLGTRVSRLEDFHESDEVNEIFYEETLSYDLAMVREDLRDLDYQIGEWFYWSVSNARFNQSSAVCTSHPNAYFAIVAFVSGDSFNGVITGPNTWKIKSGEAEWINVGNYAMYGSTNLLRHSSVGASHYLIDRGGDSVGEIRSNLGYGEGNTSTIRKAASRFEACGF